MLGKFDFLIFIAAKAREFVFGVVSSSFVLSGEISGFVVPVEWLMVVSLEGGDTVASLYSVFPLLLFHLCFPVALGGCGTFCVWRVSLMSWRLF